MVGKYGNVLDTNKDSRNKNCGLPETSYGTTSSCDTNMTFSSSFERQGILRHRTKSGLEGCENVHNNLLFAKRHLGIDGTHHEQDF